MTVEAPSLPRVEIEAKTNRSGRSGCSARGDRRNAEIVLLDTASYAMIAEIAMDGPSLNRFEFWNKFCNKGIPPPKEGYFFTLLLRHRPARIPSARQHAVSAPRACIAHYPRALVCMQPFKSEHNV
jgi:hypothetical protein